MLTPADDAALRREMAAGWPRWGETPGRVVEVAHATRRIEASVARTAEILAALVREGR